MPKFTGATVEKAIQQALTSLQLTKEEVSIQILDEGKKGFLGMGKKEAVVEVSKNIPEVIEETVEQTVTEVLNTPEEVVVEEVVAPEETKITEEVIHPKQKVLENLEDEEALRELSLYLTEITKELGAPAFLRLERTPEVLIFHLETEKQGLLIGKHGKVLNALQYLAQVFIHRVAKNKLSIVVNVGDYRQRRQEILERLAKRTADKVKQTRQAVFLEPMPAFERKQIHAALSQNPYVKTHSEGDEPYRYLVVEPSDKPIF